MGEHLDGDGVDHAACGGTFQNDAISYEEEVPLACSDQAPYVDEVDPSDPSDGNHETFQDHERDQHHNATGARSFQRVGQSTLDGTFWLL